MSENKILPFLVALTSAWFAQFLKVIYNKLKNNTWDWNVFKKTGGMPSSHSAAFSALSTIIYFQEGISTTLSISLAITVLVIYDATHVRWFAGISSQKITNLTNQLVKKELIKKNEILNQPTRSTLGHSKPEVIAGLIAGILYASLIYGILKLF